MADQEESLGEMLAELSPDEVAEFVADLWRARGREARRDGDVVVDEEGVVLRPVVGGNPENRTPGRTKDLEDDAVRTVEAGELENLLLYGIGREEARVLVAETFDRPLEALLGTSRGGSADDSGGDDRSGGEGASADPATGGRQASTGGTDTEPDGTDPDPGALSTIRAGPNRHRTLLVATAVLLIAGVVGVVVLSAAEPAGIDGTATPGTPTGTELPEGAGDTPTLSGERMADSGSPGHAALDPEVLPRGVSVEGEGVTDPVALGIAHARQVSNRSYVLVMTYAEYRNGTRTGFRRERIRVRRPGLYTTSIVGAGRLIQEPVVVSSVDRYSTGSVSYVRRITDDGPEYSRRQVLGTRFGLQANRVQRVVSGTASADRFSVVGSFQRDGTAFFWVRFSGAAGGDGEGSVGSFLVDEHGVVHELRRRRPVEDHPDVVGRVTVRYVRFGDVPVEAPPWYPDARNATAGADSMKTRTDASGG